MPYMIKCWIEVEAEDPEIYDNKTLANDDQYHLQQMQPENKYEVVECDEAGREV